MARVIEVDESSSTAPSEPESSEAPAEPSAPAQAKKGQGKPRDRFDSLPKSRRVGAHRIVGAPRKLWIYLLSALLGIVVLTGTGIFAIAYTGTDITQWGVEEEPEAPAPPPVTPAIDSEAEVVVLNGTGMVGFGGIVDGLITENQWGRIIFSGDAAASNVSESIVFYASVADEAYAKGLAQELGGIQVYQSYDYAAYGARLIVVLGQDYRGPGSDQLVLPEPAPAAETSDESGGDSSDGAS